MDLMTIFVVCGVLGLAFSYAILPALRYRQKVRRLATAGDSLAFNSPAPQDKPATTRPDGAILARSVEAVGSAAPVALQSTSLFVDMKPDQRGHTAIGAKPGDGKTQTGIALMVRDIAHGAEVYWLNPQYTYYHPIDQPTDLRPIKHLFTAVDDYRQILSILKAAHALGEQRKPLYKAGLNVGHNIVLHLDEWPAIFAELGDEVSDILQRLLRECRKLNIWVVLGAQDFLVKTTGFSSGVRSTFNTKLVGNVDRTTWGELLGGSQDKQPVAKGTWMTEDGLIQVVRPQARLIESMAAVLRPHNVGSLVSTVLTDQEWLSAELEPESLPTAPPVPATCTDDDHGVSALGTAGTPAGTGYPVHLSYLRDGKPVTVELTEERAAAIEKWLTLDRLSANQIAPKLRIARGAVYAMVTHVEGQLKSREVTV